ncbi:MAG: DUF6453 family protein [Planctomycetota bacterium]
MFLHRFKKELPVLDRTPKSVLATASLALSLGAASAQHASIVSVTGDIVDGGALPPDLTQNVVDDANGQVFFEGTTTLLADVTVDGGGTISAGTAVDIYLFHFDPPIPGGGFQLFTASGTVTFDNDILGTASTLSVLEPTDNLAGTTTAYSTFNARGFESTGGNPDTISFAGATATISAFSGSNNPGGAAFEQARIFTVGSEVVIPEPASVVVAGIGTLLMVSSRRRRR